MYVVWVGGHRKTSAVLWGGLMLMTGQFTLFFWLTWCAPLLQLTLNPLSLAHLVCAASVSPPQSSHAECVMPDVLL